MDMNNYARWVAEKEGKKKQVNIAQIKEILKIAIPPLKANMEAQKEIAVAEWKKKALYLAVGTGAIGFLIGIAV